MLGLDGRDGGARQVLREGLQVRLATENDIGRLLGLIQTPVVGGFQAGDHRTVALGERVQLLMNLLHSPVIGQALGLAPVGDRGEGMVEQSRVDMVPPQLPRQPVMAVKINLQTEGAPGGNANIAQAQLLVDEIKVVVQALAVIGRR